MANNSYKVVFADDNQIQIRGLDILELNFTCHLGPQF